MLPNSGRCQTYFLTVEPESGPMINDSDVVPLAGYDESRGGGDRHLI